MLGSFIKALALTIGIFSVAWSQQSATEGNVDDKSEGSAEGSLIIDINNVHDHIVETRLYLTEQPGMVRGEIEVRFPTDLKEIKISLEKGHVVFSNVGTNGDVAPADNIFTAEFETDIEFNGEHLVDRVVRIEKSMRDTTVSSPVDFARVGSRNLVPISRIGVLQSEQTTFATILRDVDLSRFKDPIKAAEALGIDSVEIPFQRIPGNAAAAQSSVPRQLDIPIADIVGAPTVSIEPDSSLMVIDVNVVEDPVRTFDACEKIGNPDGVWSFGKLMTEMSKGSALTPEEFTMKWLDSWIEPQLVNGVDVSEPRRRDKLKSTVMDTWDELDGADDDEYDVRHFPARLMAIVNRPDLAERIGFETAGSAGEGRFVFGLVDNDSSGCNPMPFTVILEYGIEGGQCAAVKNWHQQWKDLDRHALGSATYNAALQAITDDFAVFGAQKPGESALKQLRTNEKALGQPWQLREFMLNRQSNLELSTLKQTPQWGFNNTETLQEYLSRVGSDVVGGENVVPERLPGSGQPFLATFSEIEEKGVWRVPNPDGLPNHAEIRREFSLGTCGGCHNGETGTKFTHIGKLGQRAIHERAELSDFLTGTHLPDPEVDGKINKYSDLEERRIVMSNILTRHCLILAGQPSIQFVH